MKLTKLVVDMLYDNCMADVGYWKMFASKSTEEQLEELKRYFPMYDYNKLQEQADSLSDHQCDVIVCGEASEQEELVSDMEVEYLYGFLVEVFEFMPPDDYPC